MAVFSQREEIGSNSADDYSRELLGPEVANDGGYSGAQEPRNQVAAP